VETTVIRDIYARPISRGYYFLQTPGLGPYKVFIHTNSDGVWVVEDLTLPIGSTKRFKTIESVHPHSVLTRLNMDGEAMEPSSHGYDAPSKLDELGKIEQLTHAAKAELRRCEMLACQVMGVAIADGSQTAEACFDLAWNGRNAEWVIAQHVEEMQRKEKEGDCR
jgi:hypothetical protein